MGRDIYTEEHEAFRDMVRSFIEKEIAPHHEQWEKDGIVSREVWLAAELQQVFQDTVVRPYREGGRAPEERERLMEMAGRLKPLMIQSVVASFQRAVDKAIRRSVPD